MFQELAERFVAAVEQIPAALDRNTEALNKALHFRQQLTGDTQAEDPPQNETPPAEAPKGGKSKVVVKKPADKKQEEAPEVPYEEIAELIKSTYDRADKTDPSNELRRSCKDAWFAVMKDFGVDGKNGGTGRDIPAAKRGEAMAKFKAKVEELFTAFAGGAEEENDGV